MSVIIRGMEMPTSCEKCPCKTADAFGGLGCQATGYIPLRKVNQNRPDWCPLVPVPTPHGRLIDADKIGLTDFEIILCQKGNPFKNALEMLLEKIENAPTVIPASEEGE